MHTHFMDEALVEAQRAFDHGMLPVGAVLVLDQKIIARGHKTPSETSLLSHAEANVIRRSFSKSNPHRLEKADAQQAILYATLEPCIMCFGTAAHVSIGTIVYALEDPYGGGIPEQPLAHLADRSRYNREIDIISGIRRAESLEMIQKFLLSDAGKDYLPPFRDAMLNLS